jgi:hypothetical protein
MPKRVREPSVRPTEGPSIRPTDRPVFEHWNEMLKEMQGEVVDRLNCLDRQCVGMTCHAHKQMWYNVEFECTRNEVGRNMMSLVLLRNVGQDVDLETAYQFFSWIKKHSPESDIYLVEVAKGAVLKYRHSFINELSKLPLVSAINIRNCTIIAEGSANMNVIQGALWGAITLDDLNEFKHYYTLGKKIRWVKECGRAREYRSGFPDPSWLIFLLIRGGRVTFLDWMECEKLLGGNAYSSIFHSLAEQKYNVFDWVLRCLHGKIIWSYIGDNHSSTIFSIHTIIDGLMHHGEQRWFDRLDTFLESNRDQSISALVQDPSSAARWTITMFDHCNIDAYYWLKKHRLISHDDMVIMKAKAVDLLAESQTSNSCFLETLLKEDDCDESIGPLSHFHW